MTRDQDRKKQQREDWIRNNPGEALTNLAYRIDRAHRHLPDTFTHLAEQLYIVDNLKARDYSAVTSNTPGVTNPTLASFTNRNEVTGRKDLILDGIITLDVCVTMLEDYLRKAQHTRAKELDTDDEDPDQVKPRCIGDNTPDGAACELIPIARTNRWTHERIDDDRCLDCGARWDASTREADEERKRQSDERRARRFRQAS